MEIHLSPDQEAHLTALAASSGYSPDAIVQEAVELWEKHKIIQLSSPRLTPQEAGTRILNSRPRHTLPDGMTIREMIDYGRA